MVKKTQTFREYVTLLLKLALLLQGLCQHLLPFVWNQSAPCLKYLCSPPHFTSCLVLSRCSRTAGSGLRAVLFESLSQRCRCLSNVVLFAGVALDVMYDCSLICIRLAFGVDQQGFKHVVRSTVGGNPVLLKDMRYKKWHTGGMLSASLSFLFSLRVLPIRRVWKAILS